MVAKDVAPVVFEFPRNNSDVGRIFDLSFPYTGCSNSAAVRPLATDATQVAVLDAATVL